MKAEIGTVPNSCYSRVSAIAIDIRAASVYVSAAAEHRRCGCEPLGAAAIRKAYNACICARQAIRDLSVAVPEVEVLRSQLDDVWEKLTAITAELPRCAGNRPGDPHHAG